MYACDQQPDKTDWLENAPELSQNTASGAQDSPLSDVGHAHNSHH
jgi:hypothetical protein